MRVVAVDHVGEPLGAVHPPRRPDRPPLRGPDARRGGARCDVALLALPHKVSAQQVPEILKTGARIVDMSGDFRLRDAAAYEKLLRREAPAPRAAGDVRVRPAGTEPRGDQKAANTSRRRAASRRRSSSRCCRSRAPGSCRGVVQVVGITGSSGSGIAPAAGTHHPVRAVNLKTYKPLDHQHAPEIVETLASAGAKDVQLRFVPVSAPLSRGIFATCFVELPADMDGDALAALFQQSLRQRAVRAIRARPAARSGRGLREQLRRGRLHAGAAGRRDANGRHRQRRRTT